MNNCPYYFWVGCWGFLTATLRVTLNCFSGVPGVFLKELLILFTMSLAPIVILFAAPLAIDLSLSRAWSSVR